MNHKKPEWEDGYGLMPAVAPLASPYVPFQQENAIQYDASKALIRGTLYPGLDLPFMGMVNKKPLPDTPMSQLQVIGFAIQELALYLDTHREDSEALELYRKYQQLYRQQELEYAKKYSPLTHTSKTDSAEYQWLNDPWPWEYCGNKEGK